MAGRIEFSDGANNVPNMRWKMCFSCNCDDIRTNFSVPNDEKEGGE